MKSEAFSLRGKRVAVFGSRGMVGAALLRRLESENCTVVAVSREQADLRRQREVEQWFSKNRPDLVFLAAAKVGGIGANNRFPADFLYDNLMIEGNVLNSAKDHGVAKLVFLGSSCIYPKSAPQPLQEEALLTGPLEPTNEWYAIAKIAGIKLCEAYRRQYDCDFISLQPTNLYGPGDNFDLESCHVLPALLRKAHEGKAADARQLTIWGSGTPLREFLHVDDLADAAVFLAKAYSGDLPINVGGGDEVSIAELARLVAGVVGFEGELVFDPTQPDGTPRKRLDLTRLDALGWQRRIPLEEGLRSTYAWFRSSQTMAGPREQEARVPAA